MKPSEWPYYETDDKSVYLLSILFLTWCSANTSNPPTSTEAGLKTFFWVVILTNVAAILFIHGMQFAAWKEVNNDVWMQYIATAVCYSMPICQSRTTLPIQPHCIAQCVHWAVFFPPDRASSGIFSNLKTVIPFNIYLS